MTKLLYEIIGISGKKGKYRVETYDVIDKKRRTYGNFSNKKSAKRFIQNLSPLVRHAREGKIFVRKKQGYLHHLPPIRKITKEGFGSYRYPDFMSNDYQKRRKKFIEGK